MSDPEAYRPASRGLSLERSREEVLDAARPLPPYKDVVIEELSEDEDRLFLAAILDSLLAALGGRCSLTQVCPVCA